MVWGAGSVGLLGTRMPEPRLCRRVSQAIVGRNLCGCAYRSFRTAREIACSCSLGFGAIEFRDFLKSCAQDWVQEPGAETDHELWTLFRHLMQTLYEE